MAAFLFLKKRASAAGVFDPNLPPDSDNEFATGFYGTSFAAPQVAALASYMWLLSPDLRNNQSMETTRHPILANTRGNGIDAYASVLSLDQAVEPSPQTAPIRMALLDVDGDGAFTDKDIDIFLHSLYFVDEQGNVTNELPTNPNADYSRFDLNGDGFTTSSSAHREKFDLDRVGSTQYGPTVYSTVTQTIEGQPVGFEETALTDTDILCYYAYSPLYSGDPAARKSLLGGRCSMSISPTTVTLHPGDTQLFTASGNATFTGSGGSIAPQSSTTALYTAGDQGGTFSVLASDGSHDAGAEVTIQPADTVLSGTLTASVKITDDNGGLVETTDREVSVQVTVDVAPNNDLSITKVTGNESFQLQNARLRTQQHHAFLP